MEFSCERQKLEKFSLIAARFAGTKSTPNLPEGVLLTSKEDCLVLKGYNLELGITTKMPATIKIKGSVVLPSKILSDIARKASGESLNVTVSDNFLTIITSNKNKFSISGINPDLYPKLPNIEPMEKFRINARKLKEMIKQTIFAASSVSSESDPVYTGVLFDIKDQKIRLVALDGYRMATRSEQIESDKKTSFIVPAKSLSEVLKLMSESESDVVIFVGKNHVLIEISEFKIVSRLIEGKFLDYDSSTPKNFSTQILVSTAQLIKAIERVSVITTDTTKTPIRLIFKENTLRVFCSAGSGKASDMLPAEIQGDTLEIGLNSKYLLEALKNSESDQIRLQMNGALSPVKIVPLKTEEFMFLVLPIRLKTEETVV